ncbi:MAG: MMPL family transporter, partial [Deltaproteobacteria bacterium]|nr:MMPL family transporter [Deltaproteobacteria bacterium]
INIVIFIPCILSFLSPPKLRELREEGRPGLTERLLTKIAILTTNRRSAWLILGGFCLLIIIGGIGTAKMKIGGRAPGAGAFYENSHYSRQQKNISKYFPGAITYYVVVEGKEKDSIKSHYVLEKIGKFQEFLEKNQSVGNTLSLVDYLQKMSVVLHDGDEKFYHLPRIGDPALGYCLNEKYLRKRVAEYLDLYTAGEPGQFDFMIDYDYQRTNIQVFLKDMEPGTVRTVLKQSKDWREKNWIGTKAGEVADLRIAGGLAGMVGAINEELGKGLLRNITEISIIVFICCLIFLRSFVGATIVILSLFTRVIITYGIMGFSNMPLTMFTMPIASMGIGIGVDYVIYIIKRIEEELAKTNDQDLQYATIKALTSTGKAVIYTVLAVVLGVLIWVVSPMRFQMELGLMIGLIIFLNGVGAILLISPILFILKPKFIYRGCR